MTNRALDAASVGLLAGRALARSSEASVIARFERSACLDIGGSLVTIADRDLYDGPLTIRLNRPFAALDIEKGQRWTASPARLRRQDGLNIDLTSAPIWRPDLPKSPPHPGRLRRGLDHLLDLLREQGLPKDGLLGLVITDRQVQNAIERAAVVPIDALRKDLSRRLANGAIDPPPVAGLIGLGPGLTPSGDDLLCGVLITCRHLGEIEVAASLAATVNAAATTATTPISRAHLAAAAEGYAAAPLHDLLAALVDDDRRAIGGTLDVVAGIGHSSGLDAVAGMVLAATAWLSRT